MATISGATNERVFHIPRWLGLNEHPDGDTRLKIGEASKMINWKITRDGNLKRRPGTQFVAGLSLEYSVEIAKNQSSIGLVKWTDVISVYNYVSANEVPGYIVLKAVGQGTVESGVLKNIDAEVNGGVVAIQNEEWKISNGVLKNIGSSGVDYTVQELAGILAALEPGEHLYCRVDDVPYALSSTSLVNNGDGTYYLGGYHVTAKSTSTGDPSVASMWAGVVAGEDRFLAACDGGLWSLYDSGEFVRSFLGTMNTDKGVGFIPFDGKVYILNGYEYYCYDGTNLTTVHGYRPLVAIAIAPVNAASNEGVTTGEYVNRLNGERRVWLSPDGNTNKTFKLPEKAHQIDWVKTTDTDTAIAYTFTADTDTVTITGTLAKSVNSVEIGYTVSTTYRTDVTGNLFGELYSGTTDTRIFIYGDGTNRALYSGMDHNGQPRADYFPDQYEVRVGDSNTPITAMVRHYGTLVCYKPNECWSLQHGIVELATSELTPAIYCTPVNRDKGNIAPGQVRLVDNNPVTCSGTELYQWVNSSYYTSNLTRDERQTRRISDRVSRSIKEFDFKTACMWDDDDHQEFYIVQNKIALVWNYAADAWYRYENFDAVQMCGFHGDLYIGTSDGKIKRVGEDIKGDDEYKITAVWESGAIDFGADYQRKYSSMLWVGLKPEKGTSVDVCVETDRKNTFRDKVVSSEKAKIAGQPFVVKTKIKAKKFEFYRLILSVDEKMPAVTVTNVDFRVRQTGYAK